MYDFSDYVGYEKSFWDGLITNSIYQCLYQWIILLLLIAVLIFAVLIYLNVKNKTVLTKAPQFVPSGGKQAAAEKLVFCKGCGSQYSAAGKSCPHCGTKRER